jgi:hypothetical protein
MQGDHLSPPPEVTLEALCSFHRWFAVLSTGLLAGAFSTSWGTRASIPSAAARMCAGMMIPGGRGRYSDLQLWHGSAGCLNVALKVVAKSMRLMGLYLNVLELSRRCYLNGIFVCCA